MVLSGTWKPLPVVVWQMKNYRNGRMPSRIWKNPWNSTHLYGPRTGNITGRATQRFFQDTLGGFRVELGTKKLLIEDTRYIIWIYVYICRMIQPSTIDIVVYCYISLFKYDNPFSTASTKRIGWESFFFPCPSSARKADALQFWRSERRNNSRKTKMRCFQSWRTLEILC